MGPICMEASLVATSAERCVRNLYAAVVKQGCSGTATYWHVFAFYGATFEDNVRTPPHGALG
jgi:hypothetical protein